MIVQIIGPNGLLLAMVGFLAGVVYVYSLPIRTAFAWGETRIAGISFVYSIYIIVFTSFALIGNSFASAWPYFFPIAFLSATAQQSTPKWSFSDFLLFKKVLNKEWPILIIRKFGLTYLLLFTVIIETLYILNVDPSLPLIGWSYTLVSLGIAVLTSAFGLGFLYQITSAPYVRIELTDGAVEGFLPVRASDHCLLVRKEESLVLYANCMKSITMARPSE